MAKENTLLKWVEIAFALLAVAGVIGYGMYRSLRPSRPPQNIACTEEAKLCPDGWYVSRVAPRCEFALCPGEESTRSAPPDTTHYVRPATPEDYTAGWKTYRNEKYGFEVKYPASYRVREEEARVIFERDLSPVYPTIIIDGNREKLTLDQYIEKIATNREYIQEISTVQIAGQTGKRIIGTEMDSDQIIFLHGTHIYTISSPQPLIVNPGGDILSTFKFVK